MTKNDKERGEREKIWQERERWCVLRGGANKNSSIKSEKREREPPLRDTEPHTTPAPRERHGTRHNNRQSQSQSQRAI